MELRFTKMQGCGNDYIYIHCFDLEINSPESLAVLLSDRHYGIGGDGVVLIQQSDAADAKMRMFNLDGSEGKMCGNAIRCIAKFLYDNRIVNKRELSIETLSGIKRLMLYTQNEQVLSVRVNMGRPEFHPELIPAKLPGDRVVARPVRVGGRKYHITCVSVGNPHCVVFCDDITRLNLNEIGPMFENNRLFPDGVNTEFVQIISRNHLKMRVWERGSGETLACGTGACAAAVASVLCGQSDMDADINVTLLGGDLTVRYTDETVFMTGECKKVFDGVVEI